MAPWEPDPAGVKASEYVGRRVFGKPTEKEKALSPNTFLDDRLNDDLSLDRLGDGHVNKPTIQRLTPLCDSAATGGKVFFGWATMQRKHFKELVFPDPLTVAVHGADNPFHALLDRSRARDKLQAFHLSRSLYLSYMDHGQMVHPSLPKRSAAVAVIGTA